MAVPKICGIETEYGILATGSEMGPIAASSLVVGSYGNGDVATKWDYSLERPGDDARGFTLDDQFLPEIEFQLVNSVLTNGSRYYVDHAHPEISGPECTNALDVVLYDQAADEILRRSLELANAQLPPGVSIVAHKNNSDGKGNSYGSHENYLVSRDVPFDRLAAFITPHFVTRQLLVGAGKVGTEFPYNRPSFVGFQISQRADFFEEEVGLETTIKRPIVNTRDEPHCDPTHLRRFHVIVGDANMSQVATLVRVGATQLVLALIEEDLYPQHMLIADPVSEIRSVSRDLDLGHKITLQDGRLMSALEIQRDLYERCADAIARGMDIGSSSDSVALVLTLWDRMLTAVSEMNDDANRLIDWVAKRRLVDGFRARHDLRDGDPRLKAIDLQYHDLRREKCLADKCGLETLVTDNEIEDAVHAPPSNTRAYMRGQLMKHFSRDIVSANWDSVVLDIGDEVLKRIDMPDPLKGTEQLVGNLFTDNPTVSTFLRRLEGK
ncbi:MAG: Pup deamidase [Actinomycetota bacterium]|jgi:proteasome accessory factor A